MHEKSRDNAYKKIKRSRIIVIMGTKANNRITEKEIMHAIHLVGKESGIIETFQSVSEQDFKTIVERVRNKRHRAQRVKLWLYPIASVAAVVLVLLMLTIPKFNYYPIFKDDSSKSLYIAYFEMPEMIISRGSSAFSDFYDKGQYKEALESVDVDDFTNDVLLKFYVSACYMNTGNMQKAIQYLYELHKAYPNWQEVQWYLALCYLKEKQTDKAKELLQYIDEEEHIDKAQAILGKLK